MKFLIWFLRLSYTVFICYSASIFSIIIIFISFDISPPALKPLYITIGFIINLVILDVFIINTKQVKKLLGIGKKKEPKSNKPLDRPYCGICAKFDVDNVDNKGYAYCDIIEISVHKYAVVCKEFAI